MIGGFALAAGKSQSRSGPEQRAYQENAVPNALGSPFIIDVAAVLTLEALEGPLFKAVRGVLGADRHHARLTLGTARALDRQQLRIKLSHAELV
jgi:hypothetical protein